MPDYLSVPAADGELAVLGFEFRWGLNRWRKPALKRRVARNKYRASVARVHAWIRANCRLSKDKFFTALDAKLRGY